MQTMVQSPYYTLRDMRYLNWVIEPISNYMLVKFEIGSSPISSYFLRTRFQVSNHHGTIHQWWSRWFSSQVAACFWNIYKIYRNNHCMAVSRLSSILDLKMAGKNQNWSDQIIKSSNHDQVARSHLDLHKLHHELTSHLRCPALVELL